MSNLLNVLSGFDFNSEERLRTNYLGLFSLWLDNILISLFSSPSSLSLYYPFTHTIFTSIFLFLSPHTIFSFSHLFPSLFLLPSLLFLPIFQAIYSVFLSPYLSLHLLFITFSLPCSISPLIPFLSLYLSLAPPILYTLLSLPICLSLSLSFLIVTCHFLLPLLYSLLFLPPLTCIPLFFHSLLSSLYSSVPPSLSLLLYSLPYKCLSLPTRLSLLLLFISLFSLYSSVPPSLSHFLYSLLYCHLSLPSLSISSLPPPTLYFSLSFHLLPFSRRQNSIILFSPSPIALKKQKQKTSFCLQTLDCLQNDKQLLHLSMPKL